MGSVEQREHVCILRQNKTPHKRGVLFCAPEGNQTPIIPMYFVPYGELNWNSILRNIREIKDLLQLVLPEAGIIPDFSTVLA